MSRASIACLVLCLCLFTACGGGKDLPPLTEAEQKQFADKLKQANSKLGAEVFGRVAFDGRDATIEVKAPWHAMPYRDRLQSAQLLRSEWEQIASTGSHVILVDQSGNVVGGGTWVADK